MLNCGLSRYLVWFFQIRRQQNDLFGAGRGYENVAASYQTNSNDFKASCESLEQAAECYAIAGKIDSSCRVWLKIAEIRENKLEQINKSAEAYRHCLELHQIENKDHSIADVLKSYIGLLSHHLNKDEKFLSLLFEALDQQMDVQLKLNQVMVQ